MGDEWLPDVEELYGPAYKSGHEGVTRKHYIDKHQRDKCNNTNCAVSFHFTSMRRRHHCRRCGEIFCGECLQQRRRLNCMALPDANGIWCKVCSLCNREVFLGGIQRSNTDDFVRMRTDHLEERRKLVCDVTLHIKKADTVAKFWKEEFKIDIPKECQRLLEGFADEIGTSGKLKLVERMRGLLTIPDWQKSTYWELEQTTLSCRKCRKVIAGVTKRRTCRVCGLAMCKKCSYKELLLYYDNSCKDPRSCPPRLAIIRLIWCPENEPRNSLLLHICEECRTFIVDKQKLDPDWFIKKPIPPPDVMSQLQAIDAIFRDLVAQIESKVTELAKNAKSCKLERRRSSVPGLIQSLYAIDTQRGLDKSKQCLKEDTQQKLNIYFSLFRKLRNLRQEHTDSIGKSMAKLLNNYIRCRNEFYIQTKCKIATVTNATVDSSTLKYI